MSTEVLGSLTFIDNPTAGGIGLVLNSLNVPSLYSDITANRPAAGTTGRLFIDSTTLKIQRDNGTTWDTLADFITYTGTANQIGVAGSVISLISNPIVPGTGGMVIPVGTTAQRGSSAIGNVRWNSTLAEEEIYDGAVWRPHGKVLQVVSGNIAATSGSTQVPYDNTSPQIAEGFQLWTQSFTPISAASLIVVEYMLTVSHPTAARQITGTVFQGSTLVTGNSVYSATSASAMPLNMRAVFASPGTAAITIQGRVGANGNGTLSVNQGSSATMNGSLGTTFTITEIMP